MIYERIKALCKENGLSVNELEKRIGVAKGSLCKIDKHKPSSEKMEFLAAELNTTSKYLLTGKELEFSLEIADVDMELISMGRRLKEYAIKLSKLSEDDKQDIMKMIDKFGR